MTMALSLRERIEKHSMPIPEAGCWVWISALDGLGYGKIGVDGASRRAHRISWEAFRGRIPAKLHVLHKCDVRCCVNPAHLFLGTRSDNMVDMWAKRRHPGNGISGERHHGAKLTAEQVLEIRASAPFTRGLSKKFGVCNSRISAVRNGLNWKDV